ncbi:MAG TPA: HIT family protein [Candidatus Magasanikbacteria bacterium]|nr:HIT family protein [Candidatus Magasanikbacteria bacterium]
MPDCIFCKIVKGEIPSHKVYEDDNALAFLDIFPHAKGHTVVIPKKHFVTPFDMTADEFMLISKAVQSAMMRLQEKLSPAGFNVGWNQGDIGGQVVKHLHIHIFPRYENDGGTSVHAIVKNPGDQTPAELAKLFV